MMAFGLRRPWRSGEVFHTLLGMSWEAYRGDVWSLVLIHISTLAGAVGVIWVLFKEICWCPDNKLKLTGWKVTHAWTKLLASFSEYGEPVSLLAKSGFHRPSSREAVGLFSPSNSQGVCSTLSGDRYLVHLLSSFCAPTLRGTDVMGLVKY